jgi:hypothetical protein
VYIIDPGIKGQQVFGKRYGGFSEKPGGPFPPGSVRWLLEFAIDV